MAKIMMWVFEIFIFPSISEHSSGNLEYFLNCYRCFIMIWGFICSLSGAYIIT